MSTEARACAAYVIVNDRDGKPLSLRPICGHDRASHYWGDGKTLGGQPWSGDCLCSGCPCKACTSEAEAAEAREAIAKARAEVAA